MGYRPLLALVGWLLTHALIAEEINYLVIQKQAEPMQIVDDNSLHDGLITDVVTEVFKNSPHTVNVHAMPFNSMQRRILNGEFSNWLTYGAPGWDSPQNINLTPTPLLTVKQSLLIPAKSPFEYTDAESLYGKTLILIVGFNYPGLKPYLNDGRIKDVRIVDYKRIFMELLTGDRFTAFVAMDFRSRYQLKRVQEQGIRISEQDFRRVDFSNVMPPYTVHLAVDPSMPKEIQTFIDHRIQALHHDGSIEKIMDRYR